jgi:D-psicose/D-tagatose/L-ribulose 3-epimerase
MIVGRRVADTSILRPLSEPGLWLRLLADDRGLRTRLAPLAAATRVWRDFFTTPTQVYREGYKFIRSGWDKA